MSPEDSKLLDLAAKHRRSLKRFKLFRRIDSSYLASTIVVTAAMVEVRFEKHSRSLSVLWILVVLGMPNSKKRMSTQRPPGHLLLSIAEFMMTKRTFEKVVVCSVLDMREEYFEALSQNRIANSVSSAVT